MSTLSGAAERLARKGTILISARLPRLRPVSLAAQANEYTVVAAGVTTNSPERPGFWFQLAAQLLTLRLTQRKVALLPSVISTELAQLAVSTTTGAALVSCDVAKRNRVSAWADKTRPPPKRRLSSRRGEPPI